MENWCKTNNFFHAYISQKSRAEEESIKTQLPPIKSQLNSNEDKQKSKPFSIYAEDEQNREPVIEEHRSKKSWYQKYNIKYVFMLHFCQK